MDEGTILVTRNVTARKLLHEGYEILDIKPNKFYKNQCVFIFKRKEGIEKRIAEITAKFRE